MSQRLFRPAVVLPAFFIAALVAFAVGLTAAQPAYAEAQRTAVCIDSFEKEKGEGAADAVARWLNAQMAEGRTRSIVVPTSSLTRVQGTVAICIW